MEPMAFGAVQSTLPEVLIWLVPAEVAAPGQGMGVGAVPRVVGRQPPGWAAVPSPSCPDSMITVVLQRRRRLLVPAPFSRPRRMSSCAFAGVPNGYPVGL